MKHNKSVFILVAMLVLLASCRFNDPTAAKVQEIYDEVMKLKISTAEYVEAHGGNAAELTSAGTEAGGTVGADDEAPLVNNEGTETAVLDNGNTASEVQNIPTNSDNPNEQKTTETAASSPAGNTDTKDSGSTANTDTPAENTASPTAGTSTPASTATEAPAATTAPAPTATSKPVATQAPTATAKPATTTSTPAPTATTKPATTSAPTPTAAAHTHSWTGWTTTTSPTCTSEGVQTRTCSGCSATETQSVPANGHSWVTEDVPEQGHYESQQTGTYTYHIGPGEPVWVDGYYECLWCGYQTETGLEMERHCAEEGGGITGCMATMIIRTL